MINALVDVIVETLQVVDLFMDIFVNLNSVDQLTNEGSSLVHAIAELATGILDNMVIIVQNAQ